MLLASIVGMLFMLNAPAIDAQPRSSTFGKHFIVVFPDTARHYAPPASVQLFDSKCFVVIVSLDTATVKIEGGGVDQTLTVYPQSSVTLEIPPRFLDVVETPTKALLDIKSDRDISLNCFYMTPYGSEAFTPLPVASWESEYYVASFRQEVLRQVNFLFQEERPSDTLAPGQIVIVAAEPTSILVTYPPEMRSTSPKSFSLNGGEAVLLESRGRMGEKADLSGTRISASRPIGVISGHTRTLGGDHNGQYYNGVRPMVYSPMQNAAIEWLHPVRDHGSIFVYRQINPVQEKSSFELIRVIATSPGITVVRASHADTASMLQQGEYTTYLSNWIGKGVNQPITITASQPAQAMVISGVYAAPVDFSQLAYATYQVWAGAMSELTPHERWIGYGRFSVPNYPAGLQNYVTIVADPWARVWLDSNEVIFDTVIAPQGYRQTRVKVEPGDHAITSRNGGFSAIAFGQAKGFSEFKPPHTRGGEEGPHTQSPHPAVYGERMAVAYAYPVSGPPPHYRDSMVIVTESNCDSMVIVARRAPGTYGPPLRPPSLTAESYNVKLKSTEIIEYGSVTGHRIRVTPLNEALNASGEIVISDATGKQWTVPYGYMPPKLSITPPLPRFPNEQVGSVKSIRVAIGNETGGPVTIRALTLKNGGVGFKLPASLPLPAYMQRDDTLRLDIAFQGSEPGVSYYDTLIVEMACGGSQVPLFASTETIIRAPKPELGGYDWKERWLTTLSRCTKSGIEQYDDSITVANNGTASFIVTSFELIGPDAEEGYFSFGGSRLMSDDSLRAGEIVRQHVTFRPHEERSYQCTVRLVTKNDDTLIAELRGVGIESHVAITDADFGSVELLPGVKASGSVMLRAPGTRPLLVRELRLAGADRDLFSFEAGFALPRESDRSSWWSMSPGEERMIPLIFAPTSTGERRASIEVIGDHAWCDDSTGDLTGRSYISAVATSDVDFGTILFCDDSLGAVELRNNGDALLELIGLDLIDPSGAYKLDHPHLPIELLPDSVIRLPLRYMPAATGRAEAEAVFIVRHGANGRIDTLIARLSGNAASIASTATIAREYRGLPGARMIAPIILDVPLDDARVDLLLIRIPRRSHVWHLDAGDLGAMLQGTIVSDWSIALDAASSNDTLALRLAAPQGSWLRGSGELLRLPIGTYLHDSLASELPFTLELLDRPCAEVTARAGRVMLDSLCGLQWRLIELSGVSYTLEGSRPNPFNPVTAIEFSLGLDGPTRLVVYDESGKEVARLLDEHLPAGRYRVMWDASGHASGVYRYRITSGTWSGAGEMILRK